uniref:Uncharacterized protein n=1 Tax=uncultured Actinomycetes bacterium TaxID=152507 RepID=D0U608_9ACTN|nr:hypothetical protein [uncultured Actinomycetes bacterium]
MEVLKRATLLQQLRKREHLLAFAQRKWLFKPIGFQRLNTVVCMSCLERMQFRLKTLVQQLEPSRCKVLIKVYNLKFALVDLSFKHQ